MRNVLDQVLPAASQCCSKWLLQVVEKPGYNWDLNEPTDLLAGTSFCRFLQNIHGYTVYLNEDTTYLSTYCGILSIRNIDEINYY